MNKVCPNCRQDIGKEIKRKMNCPHCERLIFVRNGKAVTEREMEIFDWSRYMDFLVPDIEAVRKEIEQELTRRFGQAPSAHDLIWGMFNHVVMRLKKFNDLDIIYTNMATFLESEGKHEHAKQMKQQAFKMQIADFKDSRFFDKVKIKNHEDDFVCEFCRKAAKVKAVPLADAYNNPPLPVHECQNKQCRCRLDFISSSDSEYQKNPSSKDFTITVKIKQPKKKGLFGQFIDLLK